LTLTSNDSGSERGSLTAAIVRRNVAEVIFVSRSILGHPHVCQCGRAGSSFYGLFIVVSVSS